MINEASMSPKTPRTLGIAVTRSVFFGAGKRKRTSLKGGGGLIVWPAPSHARTGACAQRSVTQLMGSPRPDCQN